MCVSSSEACRRSSSHESMPTKKAANQEPFDFQFFFLLVSHTISHTGMREYIYEVGTYPNRIRQEKNSMQA